jgi:hypothetical protein
MFPGFVLCPLRGECVRQSGQRRGLCPRQKHLANEPVLHHDPVQFRESCRQSGGGNAKDDSFGLWRAAGGGVADFAYTCGEAGDRTPVSVKQSPRSGEP